MAGTSITFAVEGMVSAPQGSKRHVGKGRMIESSPDVHPWRYLVSQAAIATGVPLIRGPVTLSVVFLFVRPGGHFRKDGTLKPSAPRWMAVKPDASKLLRSTEDALSKLLYEDDARIVSTSGTKRYCTGTERAGALITLIQLEG
jgi:crossover junction endodeoxyribonuclease RusA